MYIHNIDKLTQTDVNFITLQAAILCLCEHKCTQTHSFTGAESDMVEDSCGVSGGHFLTVLWRDECRGSKKKLQNCDVMKVQTTDHFVAFPKKVIKWQQIWQSVYM